MSPDESRSRTQEVWDRFSSLAAIWQRSGSVRSTRSRIAFERVEVESSGNRGGHMSCRVGSIVTVAMVAALAAADGSSDQNQARAFLSATFGLTPGDFARVDAGEVVARGAAAGDPDRKGRLRRLAAVRLARKSRLGPVRFRGRIHRPR
jgi:hypothetical protein